MYECMFSRIWRSDYIVRENIADSGVAMEKKEKIRLGIVYVLIFFLALFMDVQKGDLENETYIIRDEVGGETKEVDLILNLDDVFEDYELSVEVEPRQVTEEEAESYMEKAMMEIEEDFEKIERIVPLKEMYVSEIVEAEWSFSPAGIIGTDGEIEFQKVPQEGVIITATVILGCGAYEKIYSFPVQLERAELTEMEKVTEALSVWFENQQQLEGEEKFQLPATLAGITAEWKEKKEYFSIKILCLEFLSIVLISWGKRKEEENTKKKEQELKEMIYPDVLNQLLILLEAGMTTRQAWHRIAEQYGEKKKKLLVGESEVYEAILQMDRRLMEGEKERTAYEGFAQQMNTMCYRRLIRLLVNNLEKGSKDICQQLSLEAKQAYEQRLLLAKKIGEEASTKMLIPLMLMMVLVMVIVMAPAIMGFSI